MVVGSIIRTFTEILNVSNKANETAVRTSILRLSCRWRCPGHRNADGELDSLGREVLHL